MNFFQLAKERHSVRKYTPEIIPREDIVSILEVANMAPSGHNQQNWYFVVILNKEVQKKLKEAVAAKYDEIKTMTDSAEMQKSLDHSKGYSTFFDRAPVVIAVLNEKTLNSTEKILTENNIAESNLSRYRPRPDLQSIGAALQNLSLAATEFGYATCWMTAPIVAYEEMESILQVDTKYHLVALMCLGRPAEGQEKSSAKVKKPVDEVVTFIE